MSVRYRLFSRVCFSVGYPFWISKAILLLNALYKYVKVQQEIQLNITTSFSNFLSVLIKFISHKKNSRALDISLRIVSSLCYIIYISRQRADSSIAHLAGTLQRDSPSCCHQAAGRTGLHGGSHCHLLYTT